MNGHDSSWPADIDALPDLDLLDELTELPELTDDDAAYFGTTRGRATVAWARAARRVAEEYLLGRDGGACELRSAAERLGDACALVDLRWASSGAPVLACPSAAWHLRIGRGLGSVSLRPSGARLRMSWSGQKLRVQVRGAPVVIEVRTSTGVVVGDVRPGKVATWSFSVPSGQEVRLLAWGVDAQAATDRLCLSASELLPSQWRRYVGELSAMLSGEGPVVPLERWYGAWVPTGRPTPACLTTAAACRLAELAFGRSPTLLGPPGIGQRYRSLGRPWVPEAGSSVESWRSSVRCDCLQIPKTV